MLISAEASNNKPTNPIRNCHFDFLLKTAIIVTICPVNSRTPEIIQSEDELAFSEMVPIIKNGSKIPNGRAVCPTGNTQTKCAIKEKYRILLIFILLQPVY